MFGAPVFFQFFLNVKRFLPMLRNVPSFTWSMVRDGTELGSNFGVFFAHTKLKESFMTTAVI